MTDAKCSMNVGAMPAGTRFRFRGADYLRVVDPWGGEEIPCVAMEWQCVKWQHSALALAAHMQTGQLCPFTRDQMGEVDHACQIIGLPTTPPARKET